MALIGKSSDDAAPSFTDRPAPPIAAIARLFALQDENAELIGLALFLKSAVPASAALLAMGVAALLLARGAPRAQEFLWCLLVLAAVTGLLRCYIKSIAQAFDHTPLAEAAITLRWLLVFAGLAWGAGAFLLLGDDPVPFTGICFAVAPSALLALLLPDRAAAIGFIAPVTALSLAAAILGPWSDFAVAAAMLFLVQASLMAAIFLPRRPALPAGLSLH